MDPTGERGGYDFTDLNDKSVKYWRDVGTLEAYYDAIWTWSR